MLLLLLLLLLLLGRWLLPRRVTERGR